MPSGRTQVEHSETILTVGTLGANSAVLVQILPAAEQGRKLVKFKASMQYEGKTTAEGPVRIGVSAGLSNTEVASSLNAVPTRYEDPGASEQANRRVYPIWTANKIGTASINAIDDYLLLDRGVPSWEIAEEQPFSLWAWTNDNVTTGMVIIVESTTVFRWMHD